jgi:hypothetical protein
MFISRSINTLKRCINKPSVLLIASLQVYSTHAVGSPEIVRFWLVDAGTNTRIAPLKPFETLTLPFLPAELSIEAEANDETQSVEMKIEGTHSSSENVAPYALNGDTSGDFVPVHQLRAPGWLTISAQPYTDDDLSGTPGSEQQLKLYLYQPDFLVSMTIDNHDFNPGDGYCSISKPPSGGNRRTKSSTSLNQSVPSEKESLISDVGTFLAEFDREDKAVQSVQVQPGQERMILPKLSKFSSAEDYTFVPWEIDEIDRPLGDLQVQGCSLRAAIEEANALPGNQSILIDGTIGPYKLSKGHLEITEGVTLKGHELPIIDANKQSRVFNIDGGGEDIIVNLHGLDISRGRVRDTARGGAIRIDNNAYVQMSDSIVRESQANFGGGIYLQGGSSLVMWRTAVRDNIAGTPEDGISGGGVTQRGGGIFNLRGNVTIRDSSIFDNLAVRGGGLSNFGGRMRIENSSVIGNEALALGGGIENFHQEDKKGSLHLAFTTIANNRAGTSNAPPASHRIGGGIYNRGWAYLSSSILADNTDGWIAGDENHAPDCYSPDIYDLKSYRNNVVGVLNDSCSLTDYSAGNTAGINFGSETTPLDPGLLNRSYARTNRLAYLMIRSSSVAHNNGGTSNSIYPCQDHDMRGRPRPSGSGCDIGSIERQ